jgi:dTDP-4-amino-4,6-dideoxygalactose transaminase
MSKKQIISDIEAVMRDYTGRECMLVPTGRMALYLAFCASLKPGSRILMSPVNDDVIFFVVLAAGLKPVMAPVKKSDGNISVADIPEATWENIDAVLTTNLYGLPDSLAELRSACDKYELVLVEDAAHALTVCADNRPVGTFGHYSAFSFSKHLEQEGGAICLEDAAQKDEILQLSRMLVKSRPFGLHFRDAVSPLARHTLGVLHLKQFIRKLRNKVKSPQVPDRVGFRMPLREKQLRSAMIAGRSLDAFDVWVRVDAPEYRFKLRHTELESLYQRLRDLPSDTAKRKQGVAQLADLAVCAPGVHTSSIQPYLRVPLLVEGRDAIRSQLMRNGLRVIYIYDPPLDDYAGLEFAEPATEQDNARWWARHVLPVNPMQAVQFLQIVEREGIRLETPEV